MKSAAWPGTVWISPDGTCLQILDQRFLPHAERIVDLRTVEDVCQAIRDMAVRGAGLIGNTAAYGLWLAAREHAQESPDAFGASMRRAGERLLQTRPTARNLAWAVNRMLEALDVCSPYEPEARVAGMRDLAEALAAAEREACRRIGQHGLALIKEMYLKVGRRPLNILTHCNAGKLAFVDHGSALAPIYAAQEAGIPVHVWVDETRPRNQGAQLTAWELAQHGLPHTLIADNAGGHLMQHGLVDMVVVGADRVSRRGDTANKIGTYLKALAANDNDIPFYVALPVSTFDLTLDDGLADIPIEERDSLEVRTITGLAADGGLETVLICPQETPARNWGFDVTPARLITAFITDQGLYPATGEAIGSLSCP